jgi:hypothetical protein
VDASTDKNNVCHPWFS